MDSIDCILTKKRAHNFIDLTGQKVGRLTVIELDVDSKSKEAKWRCVCDCGQIKSVFRSNLKKGVTKSCGCLKRELHGVQSLTHGFAARGIKGKRQSEYDIWLGMKARCFNPKYIEFNYYGGRGITVCTQWVNDFQAFYDYLGPRPSKNHSIERINNDGNYEPNNVRWATRSEQAQNKRNTRRVTFNGQTKTITQWSQALQIKRRVICDRLEAGWCIECIFNLPVAQRGVSIYTCTHKPSQK